MMNEISRLEIATLDAETILAIQQKRLSDTLELCNNIPFYKARVNSNQKSPNVLSSIPLLYPADVRLAWRDFQIEGTCVASIYASGGTLGHPKLISYTQDDWNTAIEVTARSLLAAGVNCSDHVAIIQPFGFWAIGSIFLEAVRQIGATALPWGIHLPDADISSLIRMLRPTVLMASPGNICRITEVLEKSDPFALRRLGLRVLILSGEILTPLRRNYLSEAWDARAVSLYGCAETDSLGIECLAESGHHVWADQFFLELEGKGPIRLGQEPVTGNLLITTLTRRATPLLRYRLGDAVRANWLPCPCGITHPRIEVLGRCDGALLLGDGTTLHASQIETALAASPVPILAAQSVLRLTENGEQLVVRLVPKYKLSGRQESEVEGLIRRLSIDFADAIEAGALMPPLIEVVSFSDLYKSRRGKVLSLIDDRPSQSMAEISK